MTVDREERIRRRAHQIWDESGRPNGRHDEHWHQAELDVDAEDRQGTSPAPLEAPNWKPQLDQGDLADQGNGEAAPKTSGAFEDKKEPLVNPTADRNVEGPREAGMTPRPIRTPNAARGSR